MVGHNVEREIMIILHDDHIALNNEVTEMIRTLEW